MNKRAAFIVLLISGTVVTTIILKRKRKSLLNIARLMKYLPLNQSMQALIK